MAVKLIIMRVRTVVSVDALSGGVVLTTKYTCGIPPPLAVAVVAILVGAMITVAAVRMLESTIIASTTVTDGKVPAGHNAKWLLVLLFTFFFIVITRFAIFTKFIIIVIFFLFFVLFFFRRNHLLAATRLHFLPGIFFLNWWQRNCL